MQSNSVCSIAHDQLSATRVAVAQVRRVLLHRDRNTSRATCRAVDSVLTTHAETTLATVYARPCPLEGQLPPLGFVQISTAFLDETVPLLQDRANASQCGVAAEEWHSNDDSDNMYCNDVQSIRQQASQSASRWHTRLRRRTTVSIGSSLESVQHLQCHGCLGSPATCCSGHGVCLQGICACQHGRSGLDCAHSAPHDAAHAEERPARHGLSIFVYPVPPELGLLQRSLTGSRDIFHLYASEDHFLERLLRDHGTRTLRPEE